MAVDFSGTWKWDNSRMENYTNFREAIEQTPDRQKTMEQSALKMAVDFSGTWKLDHSRSENFNNFMEAMGVSAPNIQGVSEGVIIEEITQTADGFFLTKRTTPKGITKRDFFIGKETEVTIYGMKAKVCPSWEGSKLVFNVSTDDGKIITINKKLDRGEMCCDMRTSTGVKCKQIYIKM